MILRLVPPGFELTVTLPKHYDPPLAGGSFFACILSPRAGPPDFTGWGSPDRDWEPDIPLARQLSPQPTETSERR